MQLAAEHTWRGRIRYGGHVVARSGYEIARKTRLLLTPGYVYSSAARNYIRGVLMDGQKGFAISPALFSCLALLAAVACSEEPAMGSPIGTGGAPGAGGVPGTAGTQSTAGGPAAGSGTPAGSGAAGGSVAGAGAAGMAAGGGGLTCAGAKTGAPAALHMAAAMALLPVANQGPCAFGSCHDANAKKANLALTAMPLDLKAQVVGKPACEVPTMMLVDAGGGEMALAKSWLWQKLAGPADSDGAMTANPAWGMAANGCSQSSGQMFGARMPFTGTNEGLSMEKLSAIRDWICAGAPGPQ